MRKLWPEKPSLHIPPRSNAVLTSTTKPACVKGFPDEYWNRGPCLQPASPMYPSTAVTGHSLSSVQPTITVQPCLTWSVFKIFKVTLTTVGFATLSVDTSCQLRCLFGSYARVEGTVTSPDLMKPKKTEGGCLPQHLGIQPS